MEVLNEKHMSNIFMYSKGKIIFVEILFSIHLFILFHWGDFLHVVHKRECQLLNSYGLYLKEFLNNHEFIYKQETLRR